MTEPVIMIALEMKVIFNPVKKGDFRINIMTANKYDYGKYRDNYIRHGGQTEAVVRRDHGHETNQCWDNFKCPHRIASWANGRPNKHGGNDQQQQPMNAV